MTKKSTANNELKRTAAKGFLWSGLSNTVCQIMSLFFGVFLARVLTPDDYGPIGMLAIFTAIAGSLQDSGFVIAIANRKNVTHDDYNAVFWFNILISMFMYAVLFACAPLIADFFNQPLLVSLSRYHFLGFVIAGFGIAPSSYLFRELKVKQRSIALMLAISISGITGITLALNGFSYWGIATHSITYMLVRTIAYWYFTPWRPSFKVNFAPLKYLFAFSYRLLITNLFQRFNWNIFSFILGKFYSRSDVGNYSKAADWFNMGGEVVNGMVNAVAQPVLIRVGDDSERQLRVFRKMLRFTAFVASPLMLGLSLVSKELIVVFITDKWIESAGMLQVLAVWGAFMPLQSMLTNLLVSRGKVSVFMWCTIIQGLLTLSLLLLLLPLGIRNMIVAYCVFNALWLLVWRYFAHKEIKIKLWMFLTDILPYLLLATLVMVATHHLTAFIDNMYALLVTRIAVAGFLYIAIAWAVRSKELDEIMNFVFKRKI